MAGACGGSFDPADGSRPGPTPVLFNSEASIAVHHEMGFRPRRSELIDNGIDTERFRPNPSLRSRNARRAGHHAYRKI